MSDHKGVNIPISGHKKKVFMLYSADDNGKLILIPDAEKRDFIKQKMEALRVRSSS